MKTAKGESCSYSFIYVVAVVKRIDVPVAQMIGVTQAI
jgi:hypothetical protein